MSEQLTGQDIQSANRVLIRNLSILSIVIRTATESAVTLVFNLLKEYLTKKLIKPDTGDAKANFQLKEAVWQLKDAPASPLPFSHQLNPTDIAGSITATIGTWSAGGGGDGLEGQFHLDQLTQPPSRQHRLARESRAHNCMVWRRAW